MKFLYDLHIHSALSPCADNENTPVNIVARASAEGLEIIAVSDHNAIGNVPTAIEVGEALDVLVVPAVELQTAEDIHLLCLFENFESLKGFYDSIAFPDILNDPDVFGEQYFIDSDDEITGIEKRLLLAGALISETDVKSLAEKFSGVVVPAHVDRDANGIVAILGAVPDYYTAVELSSDCSEEVAKEYGKKFRLIFDSDSHTLCDIGKGRKLIDLKERSINALLSYLKGE